jgi:hypothetical protein
MNNRPTKITKILSANDVGDTGTHQAGILVPKASSILAFFPALDQTLENPRCSLCFGDEWQDTWRFAFIYYNNKFRGGTRNEYRLTRMTEFLRRRNVKAGDSIVLIRDSDSYRIVVHRPGTGSDTPVERLVLGTAWKVIEF